MIPVGQENNFRVLGHELREVKDFDTFLVQISSVDSKLVRLFPRVVSTTYEYFALDDGKYNLAI